MAVDRFLLQLEDQQLAFSARQKRPSNMDEAVTYTFEMQAHLSLSSRGPSSAVLFALPAAGVSRNSDPQLGDMLQQLMQLMEKLETSLSTAKPQCPMNPEETLIDDSGNDAMGSAIAAERSATSFATVPHLIPVLVVRETDNP